MSGGKHVFKPRVQRDYIGAYSPRFDGLKKAAGRAEFTDDMTLKRKYPDMLYMRMLKSPYPHAIIKSIDSSAAEALPGVAGVLRYDDPEVMAWPDMSGAYNDAVGTLSRAQAWTAGIFDRRILGDRARWVGDELGIAIAAESEETVEEAMKLLKVEWEELPFVLTVEDALKPGAPVIHPEINPDGNMIPPNDNPFWGPDVFFEHGDFDKAFSGAEVTVEVKANSFNAEQGALEYWSGMVDWNDEGEMLVLSDTYGVDQTRWSLHEFFGLPLSKIRVVTPYQGGQHGRADTQEQYFFYVCAMLSKRTGRPVKYRQTRREHFHDTRGITHYTIRLGASKEGRISALEVDMIANQGAYFDLGTANIKLPPSTWLESTAYTIPNIRGIGRAVYTNIITSSCMRSIGNIQMNFIVSIGIEALAEKLGMDPLDLYINNMGNRAATVPNPCLEAVLRKGAGIVGWENRRPHGEGDLIEGSKKRGMGFAAGDTWHSEHYEFRRGPTQVMIKLNPDGTVILDAPTVEVGTGSNHCAVLACCESLGVEPDRVNWIYYQDTESGLKDMVQSDSSVSYILGEAVYECGLKLKNKFLEQVSGRMGHGADELDMKRGRVFVKSDPEKSMSIEEYFAAIDLHEEATLVPLTEYVARPISTEYDGNAYLAAFAEVEVDTETGEVEILKLAICSDGGTILNPAGAEGQLAGGQCMGIGESLYERMIYDEKTGVPLNFNFIDYKFPTAADWPDVDPIPMEVYRGANGLFGATGIGESAPACTTGAISNAVYNALGIRVDGTAISPRDILNALGKAGE